MAEEEDGTSGGDPEAEEHSRGQRGGFGHVREVDEVGLERHGNCGVSALRSRDSFRVPHGRSEHQAAEVLELADGGPADGAEEEKLRDAAAVGFEEGEDGGGVRQREE